MTLSSKFTVLFISFCTVILSIYRCYNVNRELFKVPKYFKKSYSKNPIYFKKIYGGFCIYALIGSAIFFFSTLLIKEELLLNAYIILIAVFFIPSSLFFIKMKFIKNRGN